MLGLITKDHRKLFWLLAGLAGMLIVLLSGPFADLSVQGQRVLAILTFAVIVWISEAISYPLSAIAIIVFIILFLGFAPAGGAGAGLLGTGKAIPLALSGFTNSGWVLVAAGLFLAAIILETGLEKRMALTILKVVGMKTNNLILGMIVAMFVFAIFMPSATARAATLTPIALGLIEALKVNRHGGVAKGLLLSIALSSSLSGIGVLSGVAQNPLTVSFIEKVTGKGVTWLEWFIYSQPFAIALAIVAYFLITRMIKFEFQEVPGGKEIVSKELQDLGPMTRPEKKVLFILMATIVFWATEAIHKLDANTVSIIAVMVLLSPVIGVTDWRSVAKKVDLGTMLLFGSGISLGELLLKTGAATWMAKNSLGAIGVTTMSPLFIMISISIALVVIRLAFSSSTSATAALIPTILGFLLSATSPNLPIAGMTLVSSYILLFACILPVNSPQTMIPYGTGIFESKDMIRLALPLTVIGVLLWLLFYVTYWRWLGIV